MFANYIGKKLLSFLDLVKVVISDEARARTNKLRFFFFMYLIVWS